MDWTMVNDTPSRLMLPLGLDFKVYQVRNLNQLSLKQHFLAITTVSIMLLVLKASATASLVITLTTQVSSLETILVVMLLLPCHGIHTLSEPVSQLQALSLSPTTLTSALAIPLNSTSTLKAAPLKCSAFLAGEIILFPNPRVLSIVKLLIWVVILDWKLLKVTSSVFGSLLRLTPIVQCSLLLILVVLELIAKMAAHVTTETVRAQLRMLAVLSAKPNSLHVLFRVCSAPHGVHAMNKRAPAFVTLNSATPAISVNILLDAVSDVKMAAVYGLILRLLQALVVSVVIVPAYGLAPTAVRAV